MDPPLNTGTSVSSGSCFSTLPSGLQPGMSLKACTSWLLGVSQSPPVESRPVTGVPLPPQPCVMSSWSVNFSNSLGRPISQPPVSVGNFVPSAQPIQAVPVPAGYPVYDQSFHRPPYQPQADFFNTFSYFMSSMLDRIQGIAKPAVTQQPLASEDLSQPSGANMNDSQDSLQTQS